MRTIETQPLDSSVFRKVKELFFLFRMLKLSFQKFLVLDLDETLIHSKITEFDNATASSRVINISLSHLTDFVSDKS